ncbi:hypothetical protein LINPERPRIM_LOCUS30994 [Linum perenne]
MTDTSLYAIDLGSETVSKLSLRDFDARNFYALELEFVDLCLCVSLMQRGQQRVDLWMMKEYGNKDYWVRIYKIDLSFLNPRSYPSVSMVGFPGRSNGGRILLLFNKKELVQFNPESNRVEESL